MQSLRVRRVKRKVEDFFLAGIGPGLLIGAMLATYCLVVGLKKGEALPPDLGSMGVALREGFWSLTLPVVILGGIYWASLRRTRLPQSRHL